MSRKISKKNLSRRKEGPGVYQKEISIPHSLAAQASIDKTFELVIFWRGKLEFN